MASTCERTLTSRYVVSAVIDQGPRENSHPTESTMRDLIPWLVGYSDLQRYLGRACEQCLRGRVLFFFTAIGSGRKRKPERLLCLAPVDKPGVVSRATIDFQRGRFHCVDLPTLRRRNRGYQALRVAKWRGERLKPIIEAASGPSISTTVAAKLLRCSAERIRHDIVRGALVGYRALNGGRWRIPMWQFTTENGIHAWVPKLLRAYGANGWALLHFLTVPRVNYDGRHYLQLLCAGDVDLVLAAAKRTNPD